MDIKKIIAKLPVGFVEDAAGMDGDGLRAAIVRAEELVRETEREQGQDGSGVIHPEPRHPGNAATKSRHSATLGRWRKVAQHFSRRQATFFSWPTRTPPRRARSAAASPKEAL